MNIDRVVLTKDEAGWFSRNVIKMKELLEASEKRNAGVKNRATYRGLVSLQGRAEQTAAALEAFGDEPFEIDMLLSKKQKLIVRGLIGTVMQGLAKTIEEYERRGPGHKEYLDRAKLKAELLNNMNRKFK